MVTHDMKTALRGNRVLFLRDGVIHGDLRLGIYGKGHGSERLEKLESFLAEMRW